MTTLRIPPTDVLHNRQQPSSICQTAKDALQKSGLKPLQQIQVTEEDNQLRLKGQVPTFHLKQVAQTVVMRAEGLKDIRNDIRVPSSKGA